MQSSDFPFSKFKYNSDSILDDLPKQDLEILEKNMVTHNYKKGEILFREGSYPTGIYYLKKGKVKKYKTDKNGREQIFYVCKSGELFGYHGLIGEEYYMATTCTLEESIISFIPKDDFVAAIETSSVLSHRLMKCMSHEFGVLINGLAINVQRSVRERLALCLLLLKDKYKKTDQGAKPVEINLSRDDLAKMVGTARETLARLLHDFKEEGLVSTQGRLIILHKPKLLTEIANIY